MPSPAARYSGIWIGPFFAPKVPASREDGAAVERLPGP